MSPFNSVPERFIASTAHIATDVTKISKKEINSMLGVLADLCIRLGLEVPQLGPEALQKLTDISPPFIHMRNPVDIWGAVSVKGIELGYREGMEAVLSDPHIDAVVPVLMLTKDTGVPPFDFIYRVREKVSRKTHPRHL
jgi:acyl-CoA synthetase (NDP forming)